MFLYRHRELVGQGSDTMLKHLGMNLFMNVVYGVVVARNIDNWCVPCISQCSSSSLSIFFCFHFSQ